MKWTWKKSLSQAKFPKVHCVFGLNSIKTSHRLLVVLCLCFYVICALLVHLILIFPLPLYKEVQEEHILDFLFRNTKTGARVGKWYHRRQQLWLVKFLIELGPISRLKFKSTRRLPLHFLYMNRNVDCVSDASLSAISFDRSTLLNKCGGVRMPGNEHIGHIRLFVRHIFQSLSYIERQQ